MTTNKRLGKGKSLIEFPDNYVALDLETTGTSLQWDDIIEIGAVRVQDGQEIESFQELINPGYEVDSFIEEFNGITNADLAGAKNEGDVLASFSSFLKAEDVLVGHNIASFDSNFLYDAYARYDKIFGNDFVDTLRLANKLYPDWEHHRLCDLQSHFKIENEQEHRALSDARTTASALECMRAETIERYGGLDQFYALARKKTKTIVSHKSYEASEIKPQVDEFDPSHPFYGKEVAFTGTITDQYGTHRTREEVAQAVVDCGGICVNRFRKRTTNYLVVADYSNSVKKGQRSNQHKQALEAKLEGRDVEIIDTETFFELLNAI